MRVYQPQIFDQPKYKKEQLRINVDEHCFLSIERLFHKINPIKSGAMDCELMPIAQIDSSLLKTITLTKIRLSLRQDAMS